MSGVRQEKDSFGPREQFRCLDRLGIGNRVSLADEPVDQLNWRLRLGHVQPPEETALHNRRLPRTQPRQFIQSLIEAQDIVVRDPGLVEWLIEGFVKRH